MHLNIYGNYIDIKAVFFMIGLRTQKGNIREGRRSQILEETKITLSLVTH